VKQALPPVLLALALLAAPLDVARAGGADSPGALLSTWQAALVERDHAAYLACLHPDARAVPAYGSREAMEFWAGEIADLERDGFEGRFEIVPVGGSSARFPPGSVRAHPIVGGRVLDEAIVLVEQAGRWTILRLFS